MENRKKVIFLRSNEKKLLTRCKNKCEKCKMQNHFLMNWIHRAAVVEWNSLQLFLMNEAAKCAMKYITIKLCFFNSLPFTRCMQRAELLLFFHLVPVFHNSTQMINIIPHDTDKLLFILLLFLFFNLCFTDNEFYFNLFRCWMLFFGLHPLAAISLGCLLMIIF